MRCSPARFMSRCPASTRPRRRAGTAGGGELLCVAAVSAHKGHEDPARRVVDDRGPAVALRVRGQRDPRSWLRPSACGDRRRRAESVIGCRFTGPLTGADLDHAYAAADVLVLASRGETYGMVVTEALARGLPVIATAVGGLPEALGHGSDGNLPGLLVPPADPAALGGFAPLARRTGSPAAPSAVRPAAPDDPDRLVGHRAADLAGAGRGGRMTAQRWIERPFVEYPSDDVPRSS